MHKTLLRQIEKYLGRAEKVSKEWEPFLHAVSEAYGHYDEDRALLDRSLSLSSEEFLENSRRLEEAKHKVEEIVKERTMELQETQARLLASIESLSLGFLILDENGSVYHVNRSFQEILELAKPANAEDIAASLKDVINIKQLLEDSLKTGKASVAKNIGFKKKFIHIFITPIVLNSQSIGVVIVLEDATKERLIDRAKSEFVTIASHQLRTPLTIIRWHLEALRTKVTRTGLNVGDFKSNLDHIEVGTKRMVALVQALLNVSRIEVGKLAIKPQLIDFVKICRDIFEELQPEIKEKRIRIKQLYEQEPLMILADLNLLRVIVQNLVTNAIKYTSDEGAVEISIKKDMDDPESVVLSVSDTGYGIPPEEQSKIFTKMFRAENVKLLNVSGTGLGLYITKSIAEACRGKIWFKSPYKNDKGTAFYVRLPLKGVPAKEGLGITSDKDDLLYS